MPASGCRPLCAGGLLALTATTAAAYVNGPPLIQMNGAFCDAKLSDHTHLFHRMWNSEGWAPTSTDGLNYQQTKEPRCWEVEPGGKDGYFNRVANGENCGKTDWITMDDSPKSFKSRDDRDYLLNWKSSGQPAYGAQPVNKALLGFDEAILSMCLNSAQETYNKKKDFLSATERMVWERQLANMDPRVVCPLGGYQMLHVDPWSMCRNFEWQVCAAKSALPYQQSEKSALYFATPPGSLDPSGANGGAALGHCDGCVPPVPEVNQPQWRPTALSTGVFGYANADIYYLEVCLLHSICENGDDLFKLNTTDMFRCKFSTSRFYALKDKLTMQPAKPEERPEGDAFCTRNVDYIEDPNTKQVVAKTNGIAVATYVKPGTFNTVWENDNFTGTNGGSCLCPDGASYLVGDNHDNCATLACFGGKSGPCVRKPGEWSKRKVQCGALEDGLKATKLEPTPKIPDVDVTGLYSVFPEYRSKPTWDDFKYQCEGGPDVPFQRQWLQKARQPPNGAMMNYLKSVYGQDARYLEKTRMAEFSYFWNTVPDRASFKATWTTARCAILGLFYQDLLYAPADDVQHNPTLLTPAMLDRCSHPDCQNGDECWSHAMRPLTAQEELDEDWKAHNRISGDRVRNMVKIGSSGMRTCLARGLEAFANFSSGVSFAEGGGAILPDGMAQGKSGVPIEKSTGYPALHYHFPGFFLGRPRTAIDDLFDTIDRSKGVKDHTWVEVMRIARIDDKLDKYGQQADRSTIGQVWFWLAPGSGIWWNTGKTLVVNTSVAISQDSTSLSSTSCTSPTTLNSWWETRDKKFKWATCKKAREMGYDSMQLTNSFCGFSWEMVDCRGADRSDADETWTAACPPPHVRLLRGLPAPRVAPALVDARGPSSACICSSDHSHINCDANAEPLKEMTVSFQEVSPHASLTRPYPHVLSLLEAKTINEVWVKHEVQMEVAKMKEDAKNREQDKIAAAAHNRHEHRLGRMFMLQMGSSSIRSQETVLQPGVLDA